MGISGIGSHYNNYGTKANARINQERGENVFSDHVNQNVNQNSNVSKNTIDKSNYIVFMKTDDMLYSGGNGTGLSYYLKYAENSTEDDPIVIAKGIDENGNEFEQTIHVNDIDLHNASVVEMRALETHQHANKGMGLTSLPPISGDMGLNDKTDFVSMFEKQIKDMQLLGRMDLAAFYIENLNFYKTWDEFRN